MCVVRMDDRHCASASMLAPDPEHRPGATGVMSHPLFWDDERAMRRTVALHAASASCQTEMAGAHQFIHTTTTFA